MKDSPFTRLIDHAQPIDRLAVTVGFFKGEHFEVEFTEERPKRRLTLEVPPRCPKQPDTIRNHTGLRNGRMTALFWVAPTKNGESSWWVVRCACGKYELRKKLGTWPQKYGGNDMCEVCEREQEMLTGAIPHKSRRTIGERLFRWVESMKRLGLSETEIVSIRQGNITTKDKSATEIRHAIAASQGPEN
ncbi:MAG: hypothetical protein GYB17_14840 [Gammaproteobacteria bacterium]|nr:hypothetical protein [Gammaproteobacteria bacterium]